MLTITPDYQRQNIQLHNERADYGKRSLRHRDAVLQLVQRNDARSVVDVGCGKGHLVRGLPLTLRVQGYDPAVPQFMQPPLPADIVVCTDVLEHVEPELLDNMLRMLANLTILEAHIVIATKPDGSKTLPDGRDPHLIVRPARWWRRQLARFFGEVTQEAEGNRDVTFSCRPGLTFVTWQWGSDYTNEHVNRLYQQAVRSYVKPMRFVALTESLTDLDPRVVHHPVPTRYAEVPNPLGRARPRCYRRLWAFSEDAKHVLGRKFVSLDLDIDIRRDITSMFADEPAPFRAWKDPIPRQPFNGSIWLHRAGTHQEVWHDFDPRTSPKLAREAGYIGSDQAWLSYKLAGAPVWDKRHGVYSYSRDLCKGGVETPSDARIVVYHGPIKPWS